MRKLIAIAVLSIVLVAFFNSDQISSAGNKSKNWLRTARIAAPEDVWTDMTRNEIAHFVDELASQNVNVVDLDVSSEKVDDQITFVTNVLDYARSAHPKMRFFVYQAPLETVSENVDMNRDGKVDNGKTSMFSQHPEWAQRSLSGSPAVFYGSQAQAFWVGKNDESVWLCPNDPDYEEEWSGTIRRITDTGVDGIYIDVPFLRGWFDEKRGWGWACACSDCQKIFKAETGNSIPNKADWNDPVFRKFVRWRYTQIENFIGNIRTIVRKSNPGAALIIEHWNGLDDSLESACDPEALAALSDVRAHEWTNVDGSSSDYNFYSWYEDFVRLQSYRDMDGSQPSWLLSYSDEGDTTRMQTLAAMTLATGSNFWETEAPDMAGSVDEETRTSVFSLIDKRSKLYYKKKFKQIANVGLYFSRDSVIFGDFRKHMEPHNSFYEFIGIGMMLLRENIPFKVIGREGLNTLANLDLLILPNARCMSGAEATTITNFVDGGGLLIATGETGELDVDGNKRTASVLEEIYDDAMAIQTGETYGVDFYDAASPNAKKIKNQKEAESVLGKFTESLLNAVSYQSPLVVDGNNATIYSLYTLKKKIYLRAFNPDPDNDAMQTEYLRIKLPPDRKVTKVQYYSLLTDQISLIEFKQEEDFAVFNLFSSLQGVIVISTK